MPDHSAPRDVDEFDPEHYVRPLESFLSKLDPFWGPQLLVAGAIALDLLLPDKLTLGPTWLLPSIEGMLLVVLLAISPHPRVRHSALRRNVAMSLIGLVSVVNIFSLIELCRYLLHGHATNGRPLIFSGVALWVTNVLLFSLWYWELDRGGPQARAKPGSERRADFLFSQMGDAQRFAPPDWSPGVIDYLWLSFTTATAFSPTDTMPLSQTAKVLMAIQSLTALLIVALVVSRAVNILS